MDLVIFEENKPFVLQALGNGDFDYIESASEVYEAEFFRFIKVKTILDKLAQTYPSPRKKEEVPLWFYISSNLSMRLHGVHCFNAFPMVVRCGGMLSAFGPKTGRKVVHPENGDVTIACDGFNDKNYYDRQTPCDQDFLRKVSKDTDADALMMWFNTDVVRVFRTSRAFDKQGIFIGDASYLFVPDNPNYEGSVKLLFDRNNHPVSSSQYKKMPDEQKAHCQWRRCYKMVTLLHTNANQDFYCFVAVWVVSGNAHECPIIYELVKAFVETVGKGVMKRLILDRGFLDGEAIAICKNEYGIDILIPIRGNMDIYEDAMALFALPETNWVVCQKPESEVKKPVRAKPEVIIKRERKRQEKLKSIEQEKSAIAPDKILVRREAAAITEFRTWSSCSVPLSVVANKEIYADGHEQIWLLIDTKTVEAPAEHRKEYHLRTATEERYRQIKCFSDLTKFSSRAFSMVVNQVVFTMLAYNLLQLHLLRKGRKELNQRPLPNIRQQLLPADNHIMVYYQNYYALFRPFELVEFLVELTEEPRKKIAQKCRRIGGELSSLMNNPRPP